MVMQESSAGAHRGRKGYRRPVPAKTPTAIIHFCALIYYFLPIPADGCSLLPDGPSSRTWLNLQQVNRGADDNAPALTNPDAPLQPRRRRAWSCAPERKDNTTVRPGVLKRKQAVARAKRGEKARRSVRSEPNKAAKARARCSAWRQSGFNSPDKCRKCEAVSQKKPRWTEKRLQYDLFREA